MIAIEVELLTGRYVATRFDERRAPEWPPHPARLFSALVATAGEHDEMIGEWRRALEWLEQQGAPCVLASDAEERAMPAIYVPENNTRVLGDWSRAEEVVAAAQAAVEEAEQARDAKALRRARSAAQRAQQKLDAQIAKAISDDEKPNASACRAALEMLPSGRGRQPRWMPSVTPHEARIRFLWPDANADESTRAALSALAERLVRLGHSSTLVACRVVEPDREVGDLSGTHTWAPAEGGGESLRIVGPGQLARLERAHERHRGIDPRVLPALHQPYRREGDSPARGPAYSIFGEWLVLREVAPEGSRSGRRLGVRLSRTEDLTRALRAALLRHADDPPPAVLSGRGADSKPLDAPHVAFLALADVASPHASGAVLGAAIVLPRNTEPDDRQAVLRALGRWEQAGLRLDFGRGGPLQLERVVDLDPRRTLDPATWTRPSRRWASVTPIVLDHNPGDLHASAPAIAAQAAEQAEEIVARACSHIGLPSPAWVEVMRRSLFDAAPEARRFMPYPARGPGLRRVCVHAELMFDEPIAGPVLLGAGRYFGVGLCRPRGSRQ